MHSYIEVNVTNLIFDEWKYVMVFPFIHIYNDINLYKSYDYKNVQSLLIGMPIS